jgi:hypothetical protein
MYSSSFSKTQEAAHDPACGIEELLNGGSTCWSRRDVALERRRVPDLLAAVFNCDHIWWVTNLVAHWETQLPANNLRSVLESHMAVWETSRSQVEPSSQV